MGILRSMICGNCLHHFAVSKGGGFSFHLLRCDRCGGTKNIDFTELGDLHSAYLKGLSGPHAVVSRQRDLRVNAGHSGPPLSGPEYHAAVENSLEPHDCGGRFRFDAPPRCPKCRSTEMELDPHGQEIMYD